MKKFLQEFKEFALKGNMIDLAVGVLIGSAFSGLVTSLTDNIIQPLLNCFVDPEKANVTDGLSIDFLRLHMPIGKFISDIINFVIMALIIFLIVKAVNKLSSIGKKKVEEAPTTKKCPFCCSEVPIEAVKCPHCTSDLPEEEKKEEPKPAPQPKSAKVRTKGSK